MGIFSKFRKGLKKTRTEGITAQLDDVMESHQEITDDLYDELEEVLIMGDVGIPTAQRVIRDLKAKIENDKITSVPQVRETMKDIVSGIVWGGSYLSLRTKPSVILVIGVNGVGKTTTIGKLALRLKNQGRKVILGAADTFRAAAIFGSLLMISSPPFRFAGLTLVPSGPAPPSARRCTPPSR